MRTLISIALLFAATIPAQAGQGQERVVPLRGNETLIVRSDGNMVHLDAAGGRVRMRDGVPMEAVDGTRHLMRNDANWRQFIEKGSLNPKL